MAALHKTLITCAELAALKECVILDCRHDLMRPNAGFIDYQHSHIPNAHHLHLDNDLSGKRTGQNGRHPLPDASTLAQKFAACGICRHRTVVVYDTLSGIYAARCWWLLCWLGHRQTRVLDGGFNAWRSGGFPVSTAIPDQQDGDFSEQPADNMHTDADSIFARLAAGKPSFLMDARQAARWRGETEPLDPIKGRIPGAKNHPYENNLTTAGTFQPPAALKKAWNALAPTDNTVHYCGSGVSACHNILALHIAGLPIGRLYSGSWSEWCTRPDYPPERS